MVELHEIRAGIGKTKGLIMSLKFSWAKLPVDENGKSYDSLEAFQIQKLAELLPHGTDPTDDDFRIAHALVERKSEVMEILTLNTSARPAARGVPKKRRAKPSDAQLPLKENAA